MTLDRLRILRVFDLAPLWALLLLVALFSALAPDFASVRTAQDIFVQTSSGAVVAAGMTLVLLTGGIDLSVGSSMFLAASVAGTLLINDCPMPLVVLAMLLVGAGIGLANGLAIAVARMSPFIVTLSIQFLGRGAGLWISKTRAMNLPEEFGQLAFGRWLGVPFPIWIVAGVLAASVWFLTQCPLGRQIYAVGFEADAARKAGVPVRRVLICAYLFSGLCAAIGGIISLAQLGAVSPTFGKDREFDAIAAAVLGGASLFGGRGSVFPGALVGSLLISVIAAGLNKMNANPYAYPVITGGVIFFAVLLDSQRQRRARFKSRRRIRPLSLSTVPNTSTLV